MTGFRFVGERDADRLFVRLGRVVSPESCAATELELDPPMAIAPAAGEAETAGCCSSSRVLQRPFLYGFGIDFAKYC